MMNFFFNRSATFGFFIFLEEVFNSLSIQLIKPINIILYYWVVNLLAFLIYWLKKYTSYRRYNFDILTMAYQNYLIGKFRRNFIKDLFINCILFGFLEALFNFFMVSYSFAYITT